MKTDTSSVNTNNNDTTQGDDANGNNIDKKV